MLFALILCVSVISGVTPASKFYVAKNRSVDANNAKENEQAGSQNDTIITERKISYRGSQLWKVLLKDESTIRLLSKLRDEEVISMWGGNTTNIDILVKPTAVGRIARELSNEDIKYEVTIDDLQRAIDEENPLNATGLDDKKGYRLTWQAYHRLEDINEYLEYLAQTYPDTCSVYIIGSSVQGRPIKLLKISNGRSNNNAIWVDGGIHAREWISPATVTYIINQFVLNYENEPKYIRDIDWYIAPVLNPDGYEYSHTIDRIWRKNRGRSAFCFGTDLNRNFGYKWGGKGSSKNPCSETYGGSGPFSEPETAAVRRFITNNHANWKAYVSFHSYGQYILYPWGYDRVVPPDYTDLQFVGRKAAEAIRHTSGAVYTVGSAANTLYPAAGGSDDWAKGSMKMKYAYTIELRDNGRYGFVLPSSYIVPTAKEAYAALKTIAESV